MEHERIICVLEYLSRYSDENNYVSIKQIQDYVSRVGNLSMPAEVTIRRDIDRLTNMGNNIVKKNCDHNKAFYALIDKGFSFNEIRFIVDSISINKFLTSKQKRQLIKKFEGMCSDAEIRQLISRITLNEKCSPSLDLLNNLDLIHRLIAEKRKINFEYGKYDTDKKIKYYHKKRELIPVKVVFFNNRFYLKCYNEETEAWRTYRIDRMKDIEEGKVSSCHLPKEEKRDGFIIDMFEPEYYENVTLRVKRVLLDDMMEHFGEYASVSRYSDDGNSVNISVRVGINQRFYLWVMKYGDGIELLSPPKVRSEFLAEVRKMLSAYPEFEKEEKTD